jgi:hypothetical protein
LFLSFSANVLACSSIASSVRLMKSKIGKTFLYNFAWSSEVSFKLVGTNGRSPTYYDIQTTAQHTGDITVCFKYDPRVLADIQHSLKLFQGSDNSWGSPIGAVDKAYRKICANVSSLSPFVIGYEIYTFTGLPPVNWEGTLGSFELAGTIPFKFKLIDAAGYNVDSALAIIHVAKKDSTGAAIFEATPTTCQIHRMTFLDILLQTSCTNTIYQPRICQSFVRECGLQQLQQMMAKSTG